MQNSSQIIIINKPTPSFTGRMSFLSPNQQRQSTEGKCGSENIYKNSQFLQTSLRDLTARMGWMVVVLNGMDGSGA